jgi:hypothetical protein
VNSSLSEEFCLLGHNGSVKQKALLTACFTLVSCLAYSSTQKMENIYFSETYCHVYE